MDRLDYELIMSGQLSPGEVADLFMLERKLRRMSEPWWFRLVMWLLGCA